MPQIVFVVVLLTLIFGISLCLFLPPVRMRVFTTCLWPWPLPWDTSASELLFLKELAEPGDILIESNLHAWQWVALSFFATGSTWVHAALVDNRGGLLTVHKEAIEADWQLYEEWRSTRLALLRPPYKSEKDRLLAIDFARSKLGTKYDPSFREHAGNCNGLVAEALNFANVPVSTKNSWGRTIYAPDCFFKIPAVNLIWISDRDRKYSKFQ